MITYDLTNSEGPLYICLYNYIKNDICSGKIKVNTKMPSKRSLAKNLGVSTITVENAYDQLISEGYMYALAKKGYYVADIADLNKVRAPITISHKIKSYDVVEELAFDFSSNQTESKCFPFSVWARLMRETISRQEKDLMTLSPCGGVKELREAIANHLLSFRGMSVVPEQIVVGAGTEYLYGLLIKLLGKENSFCIENPGYKKLKQIYDDNDVNCLIADMDDKGIIVENLRKNNTQIAHISPTHHFPTGITMPVSRRYELLAWANESKDRYIIEDDYDSEFRLNGRPVPPLMSIDACEKVIYMNTFSKSLAATIRISYMVLPEHLANRFYEKLNYYSCTVSTFEQYTLAAFIRQGYFEKHINRMRLHYTRKRAKILEILKNTFTNEECEIIENDSGLHFLLKLKTTVPDLMLKNMLLERNIGITPVTDYDMKTEKLNKHYFILNYSNMDVEALKWAVSVIKEII